MIGKFTGTSPFQLAMEATQEGPSLGPRRLRGVSPSSRSSGSQGPPAMAVGVVVAVVGIAAVIWMIVQGVDS